MNRSEAFQSMRNGQKLFAGVTGIHVALMSFGVTWRRHFFHAVSQLIFLTSEVAGGNTRHNDQHHAAHDREGRRFAKNNFT